MDITMNKNIVLAILKANRDNHVIAFREQLNGWKLKMEEYNEQMKEWASNGGTKERPKEPFKPNDYLETYDRYIKMLNNHADLRVVMSEFEYDQLIDDKFNWKNSFIANSTIYSNN